MKQYCRYCASLIYGDIPYCDEHEKILSLAYCKRVNNCKDFRFVNIDASGENEKGYIPRKPKDSKNSISEQSLF